MKIQLLLSFDHELPLGKLITDYKQSLFEPTERLFNLAEKLKIPITLFTDVLCALRYREWDRENFYVPYTNQLQKAVTLGHDVQLHLHPHWLTSNFINQTVVPSDDYSLACFENNSELNIARIVDSGVSLLNEICRVINPDYKPIAFRAGGYNIEPATKEIFKQLKAQGIKYDSSIVLKYYFVSALSLIDFRKLPNVANWQIGENGNFRVAANSGITEIPVAAIPKTPFEIPTRLKLKYMADRAPVNHGSMLHEGKPGRRMEQVRMMFSSRMLTFDNYTLSAKYLMRILDYNIKKFASCEQINLATCSHPKTMGTYSFALMEEFINRARDKYPEIEFVSFTQLEKSKF